MVVGRPVAARRSTSCVGCLACSSVRAAAALVFTASPPGVGSRTTAATPGVATGVAAVPATAGGAATSRSPGIGKAGAATGVAARRGVSTTRTRSVGAVAVAGLRKAVPAGWPVNGFDGGASEPARVPAPTLGHEAPPIVSTLLRRMPANPLRPRYGRVLWSHTWSQYL